MRYRDLALAFTTVAVAAVCACHPAEHKNPMAKLFRERPYKVADRLDCPASVGDLTRTAQAGDGRSCAYQGPEDETVALNLTPLDGRDPRTALSGLQQDLRKESGAPAAEGAGNAIASDDDEGSAHAKIDLPGLHLDADNGKASIQLPGVSVNADEAGAKVHTGWGPYKNLQIDARDGRAEIHGGDVTEAGASLLYLIASDTAGPDGYHTLGYVARGPAPGPLVVGVFKSRARQHDHRSFTSHGLDALMRLNVRN